MTRVQLVKYSFAKLRWNYHAKSPITNNRSLQLFYDVSWNMAWSPTKVIHRAIHSWWIVTLSITLDLFLSLYALGRPLKGRDLICYKLICLTSSIASVGLSIFIGKRNKKSAFECFVVERYTISYWYGESNSAHFCILAAASVGIPFLGPCSVVNGLWTVTGRNFLPYKYWWNFFMLKTILNAFFSICA